MNWRLACKAVSVTIALCGALLRSTAFPAQETHSAHWSYEGKEGPEYWGQLDPSYEACSAGHAQSPIDIRYTKLAKLPPLVFEYSPVTLQIIDNGHTIQVNYAVGSALEVGYQTYRLNQFHFHHPSEERIDGKDFDLVAHFVHEDGNGHIAVVAVLFTTGRANAVLDTILRNIPTLKYATVDVPSVTLNARDLLPSDLGYYTVQGSLTTPPCTEGVSWYILKKQLTLSADQLATFVRLYSNNARPVQPLHGRAVLESIARRP